MNLERELNMTKEDSPVTTDEQAYLIEPTHREIHLKSIDHVRLEMGKVYREMRSGRIPTHEGTRLVYVLGQIGKMIELYEIEKRLEVLEQGK